MTNERLFFLSFARVWCGAARKEQLAQQLVSDPHSPARYRVIGTLQNSEGFAKAYSCPVGSFMNPAEKCRMY